MDNRNIRRFERATRVQTFGRDNAADIDPGSKAAGFFLALDPVVAKLVLARVGQLRGVVGKPTLIENLSLDFKDIARTSRAIRLDEPGFDDSVYRHPGTSVETTVTTHADSLLKLLEDDTRPVADGGDTPDQLAAKAALRVKFIAYEIAADFVEDLRRDRDALDDCNSGDAQDIITRLDAAIQNKYSRDPDKLAAWKSASRIERAPKKSEAPVTPPPVA
jgi:hypothetical protein